MHCHSWLFVSVAVIPLFQSLPIFGKTFSDVSLYSVGQRVIGGRDALPGEFPYQLQVRFEDDFICGATLVESAGTQMAVTAAHCILTPDSPELFELRGGIIGKEDVGQSLPVESIVVHPDYGTTEEGVPINDIAVFLLKGQFTVNDQVKPLALPEKNQTITGQVIISGWGRTDPASPASAKRLQTVPLPLVDSQQCNDWHSEGEPFQVIYDSMFCAGSETAEKGGCQGDSGGPAAGLDKGRIYLAGVVSFGDNDCKQYATVFTRVSSFVDWISSVSR